LDEVLISTERDCFADQPQQCEPFCGHRSTHNRAPQKSKSDHRSDLKDSSAASKLLMMSYDLRKTRGRDASVARSLRHPPLAGPASTHRQSLTAETDL
jgi:hypothetical protein